MSRRRSALQAAIKPTDPILKEAQSFDARAGSGARAPQDDVRAPQDEVD
jgi:hypothetical protein